MSSGPSILVVGTNRSNLGLLSQQLKQEGYEPVIASSLDDFDRTLRAKDGLALALVDLSGFDQRIWQRCEELRKSKIPFIMISPQRSPAVQRDSMKHGASGVLVKPVGIQALVEYVHTLLGD